MLRQASEGKTVEDGITGNKLAIETQLIYVGTGKYADQLQGALLSNVLAPRSAPGEEKPLRWREPADQIRVIKARLGPIRKRRLFLNFSYVCPERVLVK